jgi:hypothetical protein
VPSRPPDAVISARALPQPIWDLQAVVSTMLHHGSGRLRGRTHRKDLADCMVDRLIGIEAALAYGIVD